MQEHSIPKNILCALHGLPGVGKSTFINLAQELGIPAFDLEKCGSTKHERITNAKTIFAHAPSFFLYGRADIRKELFPANTIHILLLPSFQNYPKRRKERDTKFPYKAGQNGDLVYNYFNEKRTPLT